MLQRCILVLAATIFASAGYAAETQRAASAELGFYNSQSLEDCMARLGEKNVAASEVRGSEPF
jgi:hypothetical protein